MTESAETLYLIDGSGFIFRAYFGVRMPMSAPNGTPTNAVYGFIKMLFKLLRERQPTHIAIAFDPGHASFRREIYPEYKANRPPVPDELKLQYPICIEATEALQIPALRLDRFEADDVLGTVARRWPGPCVIVTVDKDMTQLVDERVSLWDGRDRELGCAEVIEKMGVPPERIVDLLGLAGDSSDNIPGVPGIGPKTAAKLLNQFGDLEQLLARADEVKGKRGASLRENAEAARLSARLAEIRCDAPIELDLSTLAYGGPDRAILSAFLNSYGFRSLLRDFGLSGDGGAPPPRRRAPAQRPESKQNEVKAAGPRPAGAEIDCAPIEVDRTRYRIVLSLEVLEEVIAAIKDAGRLSFDLETTSLHAWDAEIVGVALAWGANEAAYIPLLHRYLGVPEQLDGVQVWAALKPLLMDPSLPKIGQNIKYELSILAQHGIGSKGWAGDTLLLAHLLDASRDRYSLDALSEDILSHSPLSFTEVAGKKGGADRFRLVEIERATEYAAEDADLALRLYDRLWPAIQKNEPLLKLYQEIELPLAHVLSRMERLGVRVDGAQLKRQSISLLGLQETLKEEIHQLAGRSFNVDSPKQLAPILFEQLELPVIKKSKTGPSTDQSVLEALRGKHPIIEKLIEYRQLTKLRSTYLEALPKLIHRKTGRVHSSFKQSGTATGRLSSSDPNLQNIPTRTEVGKRIREAFITEPGWRLISADYSQVELRLLAHFAKAEGMIAGFKAGEDIHARTAAAIFSLPIEEVSAEQRRRAKAINFGLMYGMGPFRLANELQISRREASEMIARYFERYSEIRGYLEQAVERAKRSGFAETLSGRQRPLPELQARGARRQAAERLAVNTPIQGTAADILKRAMVDLDRRLNDEGLSARLLLTVHDELILEAPEGEVEETVRCLRASMEGAASLSLPLSVDVGVGESWAEIH
ncbi:MAG: DNA polymerase I [Myxococcota bacterium]|nr:DNA polymerase I [Myxococcota bacterium]